MSFASYDFYILKFVNNIDKSVFFIDSSRISIAVFECLWFPNAIQSSVSADILKQIVDFFNVFLS